MPRNPLLESLARFREGNNNFWSQMSRLSRMDATEPVEAKMLEDILEKQWFINLELLELFEQVFKGLTPPTYTELPPTPPQPAQTLESQTQEQNEDN